MKNKLVSITYSSASNTVPLFVTDVTTISDITEKIIEYYTNKVDDITIIFKPISEESESPNQGCFVLTLNDERFIIYVSDVDVI